MAHVHDGGDGFHGQVFAVSLADRLVPFVAQLFGLFLKCSLALGVVLGERFEARFCLGRLSF